MAVEFAKVVVEHAQHTAPLVRGPPHLPLLQEFFSISSQVLALQILPGGARQDLATVRWYDGPLILAGATVAAPRIALRSYPSPQLTLVHSPGPPPPALKRPPTHCNQRAQQSVPVACAECPGVSRCCSQSSKCVATCASRGSRE